jgi:hypothetical protein
LVRDGSARKDRPFDLSELLQICSHNAEVHRSRPWIIKFKKALPRKFSKYFRFYPEISPFGFETKFLESKHDGLNYGYFQNWRYVNACWKNLETEFTKLESQTQIPLLETLNMEKVAVIHIRRGDMINSLTAMGALSIEYYQACVNRIKSDFPEIVTFVGVTDDVKGAEKIANQIGIKFLLGPNELTPWKTIIFMAKAKIVVAANSTFSWWGAFLSLKRGGKVYIPDPWFLDWPEVIGDAFMHPGMEVVKSGFENIDAFESDYEIQDFK